MRDLIMQAEALTPLKALEAVTKLVTLLEEQASIHQTDLMDFYAALVYIDMCLSEMTPEPPGLEDL
tara:strand:+ start:1509 stop:1706 length:198 start_codon:yes stop_codon:yes gene_type:complete